MATESLPYLDYGGAMRQRLGGRVQKLAIDAHLGCPNRDGTVAHGGCTFCLGEAFSPSYCRRSATITEQIDRGIEFHHQRGRNSEIYLAYFQSGTNTHASCDKLRRLYVEALSHPSISGIVVATRPDAIDSEKLELLDSLRSRGYVAVEYGIESVYDTTLHHVNRGHTFADTQRAIAATKQRGIDIGAHLILGLPSESREDIIRSIDTINSLQPNFLKLHQLQIYRGTAMAEEWALHPERFLFGDGDATEEYLSLLVDIVRRLHPEIALERLVSEAPRSLLLHSPLGGIRPDAVRNEVVERMLRAGFRQGDLYIP